MSHLAIGHTQHTGNGYGTPPQSKTFTELRMELFTIIYQHSPNVIPAQGWYTLAWKEKLGVNYVISKPVSVQGLDNTHV